MLEVREVTKRYGSLTALDKVSISFEEGQARGVIGENGAGKSTLMKILAGIETPTEGSVYLQGKPLILGSVRAATAQGIAMIHQELNLVEELSAAENIFLGRELKKGLMLDRKSMEEQADHWLKEVRAPFGPRQRVDDLSIAHRQLIEIAKAASMKANWLVLDEPTAVLSDRETTALFDLLERLKDQGVALIYISHLLDEVKKLCPQITVLRDGKHITTQSTADLDTTQMASLMVGREIGDVFPPKLPAPQASPIFEVQNLQVPGYVQSLSLSLRPGEILGLAGLVGCGRTESCEAMIGLRPSKGEVLIDGKPHKFRGPADALAHGLAYLTEDRKGAGLVLNMSQTENATLATLKKYGWVIDKGRQGKAVEDWKQSLDIRTADLGNPVSALSGGNQQKIALAKWLDAKPRVLILDEPTRGVDVGAKREIYHLITRLASEGLAVILVSSELPEILGLCHRALVLKEGSIAGEVEGAAMTEESIMILAAGAAVNA